jgi:hypothetical protein
MYFIVSKRWLLATRKEMFHHHHHRQKNLSWEIAFFRRFCKICLVLKMGYSAMSSWIRPSNSHLFSFRNNNSFLQSKFVNQTWRIRSQPQGGPVIPPGIFLYISHGYSRLHAFSPAYLTLN